MRKIDKIAMLALCTLLLGACGSRKEAVKSSEASQKAGQVLKKESSSISASSSAKIAANSQGSEVKVSSSEQAAPASAGDGGSLVRADERTEPNPPLPPEIAEKVMKGEMGENEAGRPFRRLSVKPQLQEVWYYCAPTTVSMMLESRGMSVSQHQLAKEMGTYEPYGTHNRDAIRILNKHLFGYEVPGDGQAGYRLATVTNVSSDSEDMRLFKERVRKNIDDGYPMYYTFNSEQIYPGKKGEHNVIGIGYEVISGSNEISALYYLDPSPNVQDPVYGGLKKVTPEELLSAMVTCGEPNYAW